MSDDPPAKRMRLGGDGLVELTKEELIAEHKKQESDIATLLSKLDGSACGSGGQSELEERLKQQQAEASRKEKVLLMQLTRKEQELQEIATQLGETTKGSAPSAAQLRSFLLDPALNILFQRMRQQLDEKTKKLQQATDDMAAWKFTPDSQTGKRLMSKCRTLIQENQELGKQVSTGRTAQLEAELALQKKYSEELKASQDELNEFVIQLDEEVEGMQSTICALQQQLKEAKEEIAALRAKAKQTEPLTPEQPAPGRETPELQVHEQGIQPEERTPVSFQARAPESPISEPSPVPTPSSPSPSPKSPVQGLAAGDRTPSEEMSPTASAAGEGPEDQGPLSRTAEALETCPGVGEESPSGEGRTAEEASQPPTGEEHKRTTAEGEGAEPERTTWMSEQVRTFSSEDVEMQEQQQPGTVEETTADQVTSGEVKESLLRCPEQQGQWDWEQQQEGKQDQQGEPEHGQQEREEDTEEEMEVDLAKFENDSSSTESESFHMDAQHGKPAGELTSQVGVCEVPKTLAGDDSDEGFSTMTPDQGSAEPQTRPRGLDQNPTDPRNVYHSSSEPKFLVEPLGNSNDSDVGIVDSSSGQGTEGSPAESYQVVGVNNREDNATTSPQSQKVSNSTFQDQVTHSGAAPESPISGKAAQPTLFPEVKVTAKKLPHNCSLSVVDYDTGSSDDEDSTADVDSSEEPPCPENQAPPQATNHSPLDQSPESPRPTLLPGNSPSASPVNDVGKMESGVPPMKTIPSQVPSADGDSDAGVLTKPMEPRDSVCIEENGTGLVHDREQVATGTE
ncbi:uncharacterized protein LOC110981470 [Acanthaster planci]|uniref:Uncharacterized protein LOC110981470 n=1 Tax=Acanthaster planci TaxID=133434 RepID=A0A8B7YTS6_ACAPL|nr:uncharacterized protein LOC110981470 [Acanthaster planci]